MCFSISGCIGLGNDRGCIPHRRLLRTEVLLIGDSFLFGKYAGWEIQGTLPKPLPLFFTSNWELDFYEIHTGRVAPKG